MLLSQLLSKDELSKLDRAQVNILSYHLANEIGNDPKILASIKDKVRAAYKRLPASSDATKPR